LGKFSVPALKSNTTWSNWTLNNYPKLPVLMAHLYDMIPPAAEGLAGVLPLGITQNVIGLAEKAGLVFNGSIAVPYSWSVQTGTGMITYFSTLSANGGGASAGGGPGSPGSTQLTPGSPGTWLVPPTAGGGTWIGS
jgi:hypothetical protein